MCKVNYCQQALSAVKTPDDWGQVCKLAKIAFKDGVCGENKPLVRLHMLIQTEGWVPASYVSEKSLLFLSIRSTYTFTTLWFFDIQSTLLQEY